MAGPANPEDHRLPEDEPGPGSFAHPSRHPGPGTEGVGTRDRISGTGSKTVQATAVWSLVVWGAVVVGASVPLAILGVHLWWVIPVLGAVVPFVFAA